MRDFRKVILFSFAGDYVRIKSKNDILVYKLEEIKSVRYNGPETKKDMGGPVPTSSKDKNRKVGIEGKSVLRPLVF